MERDGGSLRRRAKHATSRSWGSSASKERLRNQHDGKFLPASGPIPPRLDINQSDNGARSSTAPEVAGTPASRLLRYGNSLRQLGRGLWRMVNVLFGHLDMARRHTLNLGGLLLQCDKYGKTH